jgi:hypothetical protein
MPVVGWGKTRKSRHMLCQTEGQTLEAAPGALALSHHVGWRRLVRKHHTPLTKRFPFVKISGKLLNNEAHLQLWNSNK